MTAQDNEPTFEDKSSRRRTLALFVEVPFGVLLTLGMALAIFLLQSRDTPPGLKLASYALCPVPTLDQLRIADEAGVTLKVPAAIIAFDITEEEVTASIYYPPASQTCKRHAVIVNRSITAELIKGRQPAALDVMEVADGHRPGAPASVVFADMEGFAPTLKVRLPGLLPATQVGRAELILDVSGFQEGPQWPDEVLQFLKWGQAGAGYEVRRADYVRVYVVEPGLVLERASPGPAATKVNWRSTHDGPGSVEPAMRYDFSFADDNSGLSLSLANPETLSRVQLWLVVAGTVLGIGVGFLVDGLRYVLRGA